VFDWIEGPWRYMNFWCGALCGIFSIVDMGTNGAAGREGRLEGLPKAYLPIQEFVIIGSLYALIFWNLSMGASIAFFEELHGITYIETVLGSWACVVWQVFVLLCMACIHGLLPNIFGSHWMIFMISIPIFAANWLVMFYFNYQQDIRRQGMKALEQQERMTRIQLEDSQKSWDMFCEATTYSPRNSIIQTTAWGDDKLFFREIASSDGNEKLIEIVKATAKGIHAAAVMCNAVRAQKVGDREETSVSFANKMSRELTAAAKTMNLDAVLRVVITIYTWESFLVEWVNKMMNKVDNETLGRTGTQEDRDLCDLRNHLAKYICFLQYAVTKPPPYKGVGHVWRGVAVGEKSLQADVERVMGGFETHIGQAIVWDGFTSTSIEQQPALDFAGTFIFVITLPQEEGVSAKDVTALSFYIFS
jgi:hypothetical protein